MYRKIPLENAQRIINLTASEKEITLQKARMIKKQTEPKKIEDQEKIRQMLKQKEEIMKAYIDSKEHKEVSRPKDYDEIRKEKIIGGYTNEI